ncbi:type II toxin-antitoxin system HipA family toxin, partial [Vibrio vulnificus]|nr:type II toxin-antitoxin system HipA family toxin [Vibrio vulnificus]
PYQDDNSNHDLHYLVKYPRGSRSTIDCNILRAEFYFYHELTEMGVETISTDGMRLEEGLNYPSLWLPRFDVQINEQQIE